MGFWSNDPEEYDPYVDPNPAKPDDFEGNWLEQKLRAAEENKRREQEYRKQQTKDARTFGVGGPNHDYDIRGTTADLTKADYTQANQARGQMQALGGLLNDAAQGKGPSGAGLAADAQREAALSQASALQAGRRGRSAVAGARIGQNAATMGTQQAAQNEAIGRANEMATARGQYSGLLSTLRGQDIGMGQFDAGAANQMSQFNASQNQQANLANQAAQLGISTQELQARQEQEKMRYGNLDPGGPGWGQQTLNLAAQAVPGFLARGGSVGSDRPVRFLADGGEANPYLGQYGFTPRQDQVQLMGIGQRVVPDFRAKRGMDWGEVAGHFLAGLVGRKAEKDRAKKKEEDKQKDLQAQRDRNNGLTDEELRNKKAEDLRKAEDKRQRQRQYAELDRPQVVRQQQNTPAPAPEVRVESPDDIIRLEDNPYLKLLPNTDGQALARGGHVPGTMDAIVGEAGPELVLGRAGNFLVSGPTAVTLGEHGKDTVVPLTDPEPKLRQARKQLQSEGTGMRSRPDLVGTIARGMADLMDRMERIEGRKKSGGR